MSQCQFDLLLNILHAKVHQLNLGILCATGESLSQLIDID
jgi:hypothetical protein